VVGGYKIDALARVVHQIDPSVQVVENKEYATTHRMVSLLKADGHIEGDLLVMDADYLYHKDPARFIKSHNYKDIGVHASKEKSDYTAQDVVVQVDQQGNLVSMYKTKTTKEVLEPNEYYFNSLVFCPAHTVQPFFDVARRTIAAVGNGWLHVEDALLAYIREGSHVEVVDAGKPLWVEVDNSDELAAAERFVAECPGEIAVI
jgi:NDP-sugar pyrophosphorylase family protein